MKENQESNKNKNEDLTAAMPSFLQEVEEEAEEVSLPSCPAWMVTFGDAISLLLTFFVLILSFSNISTDVMTDFLTFLSGMGSEIRVVGGQEGALISVGDILIKNKGDETMEQPDLKDFLEKIEAEELMLEDEGSYGLNASIEELKRYFLSEGLQDSVEIETDDELGSFRVLFNHSFVFSIGLAQFLGENKIHVDSIQ